MRYELYASLFSLFIVSGCSNSHARQVNFPFKTQLAGQMETPSHFSDNNFDFAAGDRHSCLLSEGHVTCFGRNEGGESTVPQLNRPIQIAVGDEHSCALTLDGVKCWGQNKFGQTTVPLLNNPIQIAAGGNHTCAISADGVKCWGSNQTGESNVPLLDHPTRLSAGNSHTCALTASGIKCWGDTQYGQSTVPVLDHPSEFSAGADHTCAITNDGVICWGDNEYGQIKPPVLNNATKVSAGGKHSCALTDDGVICWGDNSMGQLNPLVLKNPTRIFAGGQNSFALTDSGVRCWGANAAQECMVPIATDPWTDVTMDANHNLVGCSDRSVYCSFNDKISHLEWSNSLKRELTWANAKDYCKNLNANNHNDWRLPMSAELVETLAHKISNIGNPNFIGSFDKNYWSSSIVNWGGAYFLTVNLTTGYQFPVSAGSDQMNDVICVREP